MEDLPELELRLLSVITVTSLGMAPRDFDSFYKLCACPIFDDTLPARWWIPRTNGVFCEYIPFST
jgi:hypothetical protein